MPVPLRNRGKTGKDHTGFVALHRRGTTRINRHAPTNGYRKKPEPGTTRHPPPAAAYLACPRASLGDAWLARWFSR